MSAIERLAQAFSGDVDGAIERLIGERVRGALDANGRFGWVTLDRAAQLLGTTADALRKRIERGTLPACKFEGRWYVEVALLDRLIRESDELRHKGLSEWTCHHVLTALRAVLRYAREHDLAVHDPFQGIPSERLPAQQAREDGPVLRADEVNLMLRQTKGKRDLAALTLLADTGLRSSELCGLRWGDVSLAEGYVSVEGQLARRRKGDPARIVPTKSLAGVRAHTAHPSCA